MTRSFILKIKENKEKNKKIKIIVKCHFITPKIIADWCQVIIIIFALFKILLNSPGNVFL